MRLKRGYKLDSYSLNNVSKLYLGDQKIDMAPKEMFARFVEGDPKKLYEVAEYCIKDTLLPHKLMKKDVHPTKPGRDGKGNMGASIFFG